MRSSHRDVQQLHLRASPEPQLAFMMCVLLGIGAVAGVLSARNEAVP